MTDLRLTLVALIVATVAYGAEPPVVDWRAAGAHVGSVVAVEGEVAAVRARGDTCVLEFAPDDPRAFRVVLLVPLLGDIEPNPERLYGGHRVRASGLIQRFQGRPEMVLRNPKQVEILDAETAPPAPAASPAPAPRPAPGLTPTTAPPPPPPASAPAAAPAPRTAAPTPDPCAQARASWQRDATAARERSVAFVQCLDSGARCRAEQTALRAALTALDAAGSRLDDACR